MPSTRRPPPKLSPRLAEVASDVAALVGGFAADALIDELRAFTGRGARARDAVARALRDVAPPPPAEPATIELTPAQCEALERIAAAIATRLGRSVTPRQALVFLIAVGDRAARKSSPGA